ncbi:MAG: ATP-dependent metallopeptidase FtsH/Yme1/Tma family protein, partial [Chloroflexota bacterium]
MQPPPGKDKQPNDQPSGPQFKIPRWVWPVVWIVLIIWAFTRVQDMVSTATGDQPITIPYSFFREEISAGKVDTVIFQGTQARGSFTGTVKYPPDGSALITQGSPQQASDRFVTMLLPIDDPSLTALLNDKGVTVTSQSNDSSPLLYLVIQFLPFILILGFFFWSARRAQGQMGN